MWILCASVSLESYGSDALDAALRDLNWVGDVAVAHESVVEHVAQQKHVTVVPMKLFTMFSSDERAIEEMRSRRREILAVVKRISGCEEWGVRITRTPPAAGPIGREAAKPASGAAFLAAKKQARDAARELVRAAAESASVFCAVATAASESENAAAIASTAHWAPRRRLMNY